MLMSHIHAHRNFSRMSDRTRKQKNAQKHRFHIACSCSHALLSALARNSAFNAPLQN
jgi:hypothetical protein